jgi:hypothetical protein
VRRAHCQARRAHCEIQTAHMLFGPIFTGISPIYRETTVTADGYRATFNGRTDFKPRLDRRTFCGFFRNSRGEFHSDPTRRFLHHRCRRRPKAFYLAPFKGRGNSACKLRTQTSIPRWVKAFFS